MRVQRLEFVRSIYQQDGLVVLEGSSEPKAVFNFNEKKGLWQVILLRNGEPAPPLSEQRLKMMIRDKLVRSTFAIVNEKINELGIEEVVAHTAIMLHDFGTIMCLLHYLGTTAQPPTPELVESVIDVVRNTDLNSIISGLLSMAGEDGEKLRLLLDSQNVKFMNGPLQ